MSSGLREYWNASTARIPDTKVPSRYAIEKQKLFPLGATVCDLGGGTGSDSLYFMSHGHNVTLIDIADDALAAASARAEVDGLQELLDVRQCDFSKASLPIEDNQFDVVYARLALHYFTADVLRGLISEIYRGLKPLGTAYFTCKSPDDVAEMAFLASVADEIEPGVFSHNGYLKTRFTAEQLRGVASSAGVRSENYSVRIYTEQLSTENDVVASGNTRFIVNEIILRK